MRHKTAPTPRAARERHGIADLAVTLDHAVVDFSICLIIIPIDQIDVFRNAVDHLLRDFPIETVIFAAESEAEEHIAPHITGKAVLFRNLQNARQMAVNDIETVLIAVSVEIFPEPDHVRLVHADMRHARRERAGKLREHIVDQFVHPFVAAQKNVVAVAKIAEFAPAENRGKVRERLDAGHERHAQRLPVRVQIFEFRLRIRAAKVPEPRAVFDLVCVLGVQLQPIVPARRE